jgi:hypothetical protein
VAKFSPDGARLWSKQFGNTGNEQVNKVAVDNDGNIIITGFFWYSINFGGTTRGSVTDCFFRLASGWLMSD